MKEVIPLFSRPLFVSKIEVSDIDTSGVKWAKNYSNWISESQDVLNDPQYEKLAERVYDKVCEYFYGIMRASESAQIAFTESWFNKTENGQSHHRHWHPNSVFSGIVYLSGNGVQGRTKFISSVYDTIEFNTVDSNIYNSKSFSIDPTPGHIAIFPSNLEHMVEPYTADEPRITLAFNTFVRGQINKDPLTRLIL